MIYGWNRSGKTTISRIFEKIEALLGKTGISEALDRLKNGQKAH
ncbi:hypothetical protein KKG71_00835 [Patescibacteria group bacterium]|nr:hypothetical protein [Patescibacteria group bacterium]